MQPIVYMIYGWLAQTKNMSLIIQYMDLCIPHDFLIALFHGVCVCISVDNSDHGGLCSGDLYIISP